MNPMMLLTITAAVTAITAELALTRVVVANTGQINQNTLIPAGVTVVAIIGLIGITVRAVRLVTRIEQLERMNQEHAEQIRRLTRALMAMNNHLNLLPEIKQTLEGLKDHSIFDHDHDGLHIDPSEDEPH